MKKTIITALLCLGLAASATATTLNLSDLGITVRANGGVQDANGSSIWVCFYEGDGSWGILKNAQSSPLLESSATGSTNANNYVFYGYDCRYEDGVLYADSNSNMVTGAPASLSESWVEGTRVYVGEKVTFDLTGQGIGKQGATYTFMDLGADTRTLITCNDATGLNVDGTMTLAGNLNLTSENYARTLYSGKIDGTATVFNIGSITATDAAGNTLTYAAAGTEHVGEVGYYWLNTETTDGITTYTLQAKGVATPVPEPATATLSLLALAGLIARRRRI